MSGKVKLRPYSENRLYKSFGTDHLLLAETCLDARSQRLSPVADCPCNGAVLQKAAEVGHFELRSSMLTVADVSLGLTFVVHGSQTINCWQGALSQLRISMCEVGNGGTIALMKDYRSLRHDRPNIPYADSFIPPATCCPTLTAKQAPIDSSCKLSVSPHVSKLCSLLARCAATICPHSTSHVVASAEKQIW